MIQMKHEKHFTHIEDDARVDFRFIIEKHRIVHFSINVSIITERRNNIDVYRVDTAHGCLHEQKFWISSKPKYLEKKQKENYSTIFNQKRKEVLENYIRWVKLYKSKLMR